LLLNVGVAGLTAGAVVACQTPETTRTMQWTVGVLIAGTTVWFLGSMSALFALSTGAGSVVAMLQGFLLRREERRKV
jgi:hypothetical protein